MKRNFLRNNGFVLTLLSSLLLFGACRGCMKNDNVNDRGRVENAEKVSACSDYNNEEEKCKAAFLASGEPCHFDTVTKNCVIKNKEAVPPCEELTMEQCKQSKTCTYQDALGRCAGADPALAGRCEVIQSQPACDADALCQWDGMAMVCKDKVNELP